MSAAALDIVPARVVREVLAAEGSRIIDVVAEAYLEHQRGESHCPPSGFLRFADRPDARIISLPARVRHRGTDVAGVKWISSFPANRARGLPRASAVIVLNDMESGVPIACLEGALISAARTAASAALAARHLHRRELGTRLGVIGCGPIARAVYQYLLLDGWRFSTVVTHDLDGERAAAFPDGVLDHRARSVPSATEVVRSSDLVIVATTAGSPHLLDAEVFTPQKTVLHLSLRDLGPAVVRRAQNVVDDLDHALREGTSLQLAAQGTERPAFLSGTIADVIEGVLPLDRTRPRIFSPFGLGTLDVTVGSLVLQRALASGRALRIDNFTDGLAAN